MASVAAKQPLRRSFGRTPVADVARHCLGSHRASVLLEGAIPNAHKGGATSTLNPHEWSNNVRDLRSVLDVVKQLFIVLQHSNEALLRVGVEILLDESSREMLGWHHERIFQDDDNHRWMTALVQRKLELVLKTHPGMAGRDFTCKKVATREAGSQASPQDGSGDKLHGEDSEEQRIEAQASRSKVQLEAVCAERRKLQKEVMLKETALRDAEVRATMLEEKLHKLEASLYDGTSLAVPAQVHQGIKAEGQNKPVDGKEGENLPTEHQQPQMHAHRQQPPQQNRQLQPQQQLQPPQQSQQTPQPQLNLQRQPQPQPQPHHQPQRQPQPPPQPSQQHWEEQQPALLRANDSQRLEDQHRHKQRRQQEELRHEVHRQHQSTQTAEPPNEQAPKLQAALERIAELERSLSKAQAQAQVQAPHADAPAPVMGSASAGAPTTSSPEAEAQQLPGSSPKDVNLKAILQDLRERTENVRRVCISQGLPEEMVYAVENDGLMQALNVWERLYKDAHGRVTRKAKDVRFQSSPSSSATVGGGSGGTDSNAVGSMALASFSSRSKASDRANANAAQYPPMVIGAAEKLRNMLKRNRPGTGATPMALQLDLPAEFDPKPFPKVLERRPSLAGSALLSPQQLPRQPLLPSSASLPAFTASLSKPGDSFSRQVTSEADEAMHHLDSQMSLTGLPGRHMRGLQGSVDEMASQARGTSKGLKASQSLPKLSSASAGTTDEACRMIRRVHPGGVKPRIRGPRLPGV